MFSVRGMSISIQSPYNLLRSDRKSGSAGMPRPRSTLFPYTTLFRSWRKFRSIEVMHESILIDVFRPWYVNLNTIPIQLVTIRSEERFSRNAETEIYTLSLHDALPILA